jgi:H+/Cl- antiporter ClcA
VTSIPRFLVSHVNDIALLIYTGAAIAWGWVFAVVLRKKWGSWRHSHREPLTGDEWVLIVLMLVGLALAILYMYIFLHGRPPGSFFWRGFIEADKAR